VECCHGSGKPLDAWGGKLMELMGRQTNVETITAEAPHFLTGADATITLKVGQGAHIFWLAPADFFIRG